MKVMVACATDAELFAWLAGLRRAIDSYQVSARRHSHYHAPLYIFDRGSLRKHAGWARKWLHRPWLHQVHGAFRPLTANQAAEAQYEQDYASDIAMAQALAQVRTDAKLSLVHPFFHAEFGWH